jgi:hypothetical protein
MAFLTECLDILFEWLVTEMSEVKLEAELSEFIESLNIQSVDFLIVGVHAIAWQGLPR